MDWYYVLFGFILIIIAIMIIMWFQKKDRTAIHVNKENEETRSSQRISKKIP